MRGLSRKTRAVRPIEPVVDVGRTELLGVSEAGVELPYIPPYSPSLVLGFLMPGMAALTVGGIIEGNLYYLTVGALGLVYSLLVGGAYFRRRSVRPRLVLTASGVVFEQPVTSMGVRWGDVKSLRLYEQYRALHLGIDAPRRAVVRHHGSSVLHFVTRAMSGAAIAVPTVGFVADPERLLLALGDYAEDPSPLRDPERERAASSSRLAAPA